MVKFDDKGQGYWDSILESCSEEVINSMELDLKKGAEIINFHKSEAENHHWITVLIKDDLGYFVYSQSGINFTRTRILNYELELIDLHGRRNVTGKGFEND